MEKTLLTVVVPAITTRLDKVKSLVERLSEDAKGLPVEIISLIDNKVISIGEKRDRLVQMASGLFVAFIDDDDDFLPGYCKELCAAIADIVKENTDDDVISFDQEILIDGIPGIVQFSFLNDENQPLQLNDDGTAYLKCYRMPFHVCAWRSKLAKSERFAPVGYGEDWDWCRRLLKKVRGATRIEQALHRYVYDSRISEAPTESNDVWQNPNE